MNGYYSSIRKSGEIIGSGKMKQAVMTVLMYWQASEKNPAESLNEFMRDVDSEYEKQNLNISK